MHLRRGNPHSQYKLGDETTEHSPAEKDLRVLVDGKLDVSQQCALATQTVNCILGCIKRSVATRSVFHCIQMWSPQYRRDTDLSEHVQRRATKMIHRMEHLSYGDKLRELGQFSLEKRRL